MGKDTRGGLPKPVLDDQVLVKTLQRRLDTSCNLDSGYSSGVVGYFRNCCF